jgi:hypothetical protein
MNKGIEPEQDAQQFKVNNIKAVKLGYMTLLMPEDLLFFIFIQIYSFIP